MNQQIAEQNSYDLTEIRECNDGKWLIEQLRQSLDLSVHHVMRMAAIIRRLEELEIPVTIKIAPLRYLRKIAYGNMLPDLYVALEGDSLLLDKASSLPMPEQEKISRNEPFKVMQLNGEHRMVPVLSMTRGEIRQVFGHGQIRSEAEQVGYLRERLQIAEAVQNEESVVRLQRRRKGVLITGPTFLSLIDMKHYVSKLEEKR